jgi:hypothetical protein
MRSHFDAIARRRSQLVEEIALERIRVAITLENLRKEMALAGLGLMASHFIGRHRWLRIAAMGVLAVALSGPLLARLLPARHE